MRFINVTNVLFDLNVFCSQSKYQKKSKFRLTPAFIGPSANWPSALILIRVTQTL